MYVEPITADNHINATKSHRAQSELFINISQPYSYEDTLNKKGHWFRHSLSLTGGVADSFCSKVLSSIDKLENRTRARKKKDLAILKLLVNKVLANAFAVYFYRSPQRVAYQRKADAYSDKAIWPHWLSGERMARTVDLLAKARMFTLDKGEWGKWSSTFSLTKECIDLAKELGFTANMLTSDLEPKDLIRLKTAKPKAEYISFKSNDYAENSCNKLKQYNEFLKNHELLLSISKVQEKHLLGCMARGKPADKKRGLYIVKPENFSKSLYRTYNDGTFEHGGRLYGGFWQTIPSDFRRFLTINGQPIVELDYSGFAFRSSYHLEGLEYDSDPYELTPVTELCRKRGLPNDYFRSSIKDIAQALINGVDTEKPELISVSGPSFRGYFKRIEIRQMLERKHRPIQHIFGTHEGKKNQRLESDIALDVITALINKEVLALPIHDSFIVEKKNGDILKSVMVDCYVNRLGRHPLIK